MNTNTNIAEVQSLLENAVALFNKGNDTQSLNILDKVFTKDSQNAEALQLLGTYYLKIERYEDARQLFLQVIDKTHEKEPLPWMNLGNVYRQLGSYALAHKHYDVAIKIDPTLDYVFFHRALLLECEERHEEAYAQFDVFFKKTQSIEAMIKSFHMLFLLGSFVKLNKKAFDGAELVHRYHKNVSLQLLILFYNILAQSSEKNGHLEEALLYIEKANEYDQSSYSLIHVTHGLILRRLNRLDEAEAVLLKVYTNITENTIEQEPKIARAVCAQLARLYENKKDYKNAFEFFQKQNEFTFLIYSKKEDLWNKHILYNGYIDHLFEDIKKREKKISSSNSNIQMEDNNYKSINRKQNNKKQLSNSKNTTKAYFIVGFPRSGTTLIDQILCAHENIHVLEEKPILLNAIQEVIFDGVCVPAEPLRILEELNTKKSEACRSLYFSQLQKMFETDDCANKEDTKIIINKMPLNIIHAAFISKIFPEHCIICLSRNPCNTLLSCYFQDFYLNGAMVNFLSLESTKNFFDRAMYIWHKSLLMYPLNIHNIFYEEFIKKGREQQMEESLMPILTEMNLSFSASMVDFFKKTQNRNVLTPSYETVQAPLHSNALDKFSLYEPYADNAFLCY